MRMTPSRPPSVTGRAARRALGPVLLLLPAPAACSTPSSPTSSTRATLDTPAGAEARRVGAIADFAFAKDGDGTSTWDGRRPDPAQRPHVRRVRALHHAADRAGDRPATGVREQPDPVRHLLNCTGRAPRRENAAAALRQLGVDAGRRPRDRRDVDPGRIHLRLLRGGLLLRGAVQPAGRRHDRLRRAADHGRDVRDGRGAIRRGAGRAGGGERGTSQETESPTWPPWEGARPARPRAFRRGGRRCGRRARPSSTTSASTPTAPLRLQNAIYSYTTGSLVGLGSGGWRRAAVPHRRGPARAVRRIRETSAWTEHDAAVHPAQVPGPSASVPVADGIEARLIEAEAPLQAKDLGGMNSDPERPADPPGARPARHARLLQTKASICSSASGPSGSSPPATAWATCAG